MNPDLMRKNLLLRPVMKGDILTPFPVVRRRERRTSGPFDDTMNAIFYVVMMIALCMGGIIIGTFLYIFITDPYPTTSRLSHVPCLWKYSMVKRKSGFETVYHHHTGPLRFRWYSLVLCRAVMFDGGTKVGIHRPGRCLHCHYTRDKSLYGGGI